MPKEVLGVDVGGVIIDRANDAMDTSFFANDYLQATAVVGAFDALRRLAKERFEGRVFLVSKCGPKTEGRTRLWLPHHGFYEHVGIPPEHVRFCRERREKAPICEELGVTHFVDDKLEVLSYLESVTHRFLFNPVEREVTKFVRHLPRVRRVESWSEILKELLP